jgi:cellulose synthase/poly-beta-1,6-N-acetylglucosamine synthase-like glycosyltransferase
MDEIDEFCKTNPQIKLYRIGGEGSKNKADNLNHFLKNSQAKFDYLLFGDADEVIDKNFLNVAIRLFYCPKYSELGYITPINQTYKTNNMYTNCCKNANDFVLQQTCNNMYKLK